MSRYASMIDPCSFGIIADQLRNPQSPIQFLLHVPSRAMLAEVAERIATITATEGSSMAQRYWHRLAVENEIRVSVRNTPPGRLPTGLVDPVSIPRSAVSHVIYQPPYYVVCTPGLFEGTLVRPQVAVPVTTKPSTRIKL